MRRMYGSGAAQVITAVGKAHDAVARLWVSEGDVLDSSLIWWTGGDGPIYNFDDREPAAVRALRQIERAEDEASHAALLAPYLSRRERRVLLHGRPCVPTLDNSCQRQCREALPDPGQVILASPHVTNGPPRLRVAPSCDVLATAA
jgi:hypothetical protein